jgi:hypothetical protein
VLGPAAIAPATSFVRALLAGAGKEGGDFDLNGSLQHELSAKPAKLAEAVPASDAILDQLLDGLFKQGRGR